MSLSSVFRNQGNEFFRQARSLNANESPLQAKDLYERALSFYYQAKDKSETREEECSAAKNIGKAAWRIAEVLTKKEPQEKPEVIIFYLHEAIKALCRAYDIGEEWKDAEWRGEVFETISVCLQEVIDVSEAFVDTDRKIAQLEKLAFITSVDEASIDLHMSLATLYFHDGTTKLQNGDYKKCLSRMTDCYQPIEEVKRLSKRGDNPRVNYEMLNEAGVLEKDVFFHTCAAKSIQARMMGDEILQNALLEQEELQMTLIFEVIDWYKQAVVLSRNVDIEQEARAESRLGYVYDKVLKITLRAKAYYTHCFELAESIKPRMFTACQWYKDCITTLKKYQEEARQRDDEEKSKARAGFLEELSQELAEIGAHRDLAVELIKFLYTNYPPKTPTWKKPTDEEMEDWDELETTSKRYKRLLIKALAVYHPDKVDEEMYGKKWKVLCEEITKMLTFHYESTKIMSDD